MTGNIMRLAIAGALCVAVAACSPLRTLNVLTPSAETNATRDLEFAPGVKLDVYRSDAIAANAPVVVFFYGGNWRSGARFDYAFVGRALAARGIVTIVADYRHYPEVRYPAFLDDAAQAVAWAVQNAASYGGDPRRVFVMGHSAGAYNAAMLALDERWLARVQLEPAALRGFIGLAGPYDFLPITNRKIKPVFDFPNTPADSQPLMHVKAGAPAALLIAPENDDTVDPRRNTAALAAKLREAGDEVEEKYYGRVGHTSLIATFADPTRWLAPTLDDVAAFVFAH